MLAKLTTICELPAYPYVLPRRCPLRDLIPDHMGFAQGLRLRLELVL
jgi:hypothetical protein